jgi:urocanate hydratase
MVETGCFSKLGTILINNEIPVRNDRPTLTMYSGHPMGLFPSHKEAPRVVVTNGMVILIILNRMIGKK